MRQNPSPLKPMHALALVAVTCCPWAHSADRWEPRHGEIVRYEIRDGDERVGTLSYAFSRPNAETLVVERAQRLTVRRMLIRATLESSSRQTFLNHALIDFSSRSKLESTIKNEARSVALTLSPQGELVGQANNEAVTIPEGVTPLIIWHADTLRSGSHFGVDDARPIELTVDDVPSSRSAPASYRGPPCMSREFRMSVGDKRASGIAWADSSGRICALRFETDIGPLDYVAEG